MLHNLITNPGCHRKPSKKTTESGSNDVLKSRCQRIRMTRLQRLQRKARLALEVSCILAIASVRAVDWFSGGSRSCGAGVAAPCSQDYSARFGVKPSRCFSATLVSFHRKKRAAFTQPGFVVRSLAGLHVRIPHSVRQVILRRQMNSS